MKGLVVAFIVAVIVLFGTVTAFSIYNVKQYRAARRNRRRCTFPIKTRTSCGKCGHETVRYYQMYRSKLKTESWWNRCYESYIIDVCDDGHAVIIGGDDPTVKLFSYLELLGRWITDGSQFEENKPLWDLVEGTRRARLLADNKVVSPLVAHDQRPLDPKTFTAVHVPIKSRWAGW